MSGEEKLRLLWLSSTLFFIIGGYWLLRSIKDPIISTINGVSAIPKAKMLSVAIMPFIVGIYNKLYDQFPSHQLFYIIGCFYMGLFTLIGFALMHPTIGIYNTMEDPARILGWVSYCSIESFGSIGVAQFWAFANSVYDLESAKKSYGLMIACAQVGSVMGPTLVTQAESLGIPVLYLCGAGCMAMMVFMTFTYVKRFGVGPTSAEEEVAEDLAAQSKGLPKKERKKKAGMMEGLYLILKHYYIQGITVVSCVFMVEVTILDYAMKVRNTLPSLHPLACLIPPVSVPPSLLSHNIALLS